LKTFPKGGVHPPENKHFTEQHQIQVLDGASSVVLLLGQHIGAPAQATVVKRDKVQAGQVIGDSDAFVSAPVHTPIAGTVKDIALASHPVQGRGMAVIIEADADGEAALKVPSPEKFNENFDDSQFSSEQICQAIRQAGLVGMGGAGFPTRVKLEPNPRMPKHTLIINGCECEPFITCDFRVMMEWTYQVIAGIKRARKASGCSKVLIGIEDNKPEAADAIMSALSKCKDVENIAIKIVKTKYPQGGERQLIKSLCGKTVPSGGIPPMIGVAVLNVATCAAIAEAVVLEQPLTHRVVTVTGPAVAKAGNYYAPIGLEVGKLIELCGGLTEEAAKVVMGGPMMGLAIADMSTPTTKTTGAITILGKKQITAAKYNRRQTPCIRCGRCLAACPEHLNPTKIAHAVKYDLLEVATENQIGACMECGCCSFVCPANIEVTGYIKTGKLLLANAKKK